MRLTKGRWWEGQNAVILPKTVEQVLVRFGHCDLKELVIFKGALYHGSSLINIIIKHTPTTSNSM